ncbi:hypothetical protein [Nocardiopsis sp. L17-MgMaSL7]|uniref:hypothetical protein n=1 Tax=Nocardiopsis sp. L17-MgMaSL7 TaxID=1938893 RepID=UPI000D71C7AC|nr:hypothetical protein [Nocardiopsis sp. L17-MgMaSL7]PWV46007.1 hypothetical protein BDW27_11561 [Nocardiopsis sp. L17-MgMaSL7]
MNPHPHEPPDPVGVDVRRLSERTIDEVLDDVFVRGRRCRALDAAGPPGGPQWLLAELGDGRITGSCPHARWRRSDEPPTGHLSAAPVDPDTDRWRILEVLVFGPHAQIRLGEGTEAGWISTDAPGRPPDWMRPRDRSLLLQGWSGPQASRTLKGPVAFSVTREPSGSEAVLPVAWTDFSGRVRPLPEPGRGALESTGTWLTVREYWAADPVTGAVGVAFHRLTGLASGRKPTGPEFEVGTGALVEPRGRDRDGAL